MKKPQHIDLDFRKVFAETEKDNMTKDAVKRAPNALRLIERSPLGFILRTNRVIASDVKNKK